MVGYVVNKQIQKGLLLSLSVKNNKIGKYSAKLQARTSHHIEKTDAGLNGLYIRDITVLYSFIYMVCLVHFLRLLACGGQGCA